MNEDISILNRNGYRLRGVVHTPDNGPVKGQPVVFLVPGMDGTKVGPHRLLKKVSTVLERRDVMSYRFDLTGQGESTGDFAEITVQTHLNDVEDILNSISGDDTRVIMAGFSMGGLVAALAAAQMPNVVGLIMMSPTLNLADMVASGLKRLEPGIEQFSYMGSLMTRKQLENLVTIDVQGTLSNLTCPSLMITGDEDKLVPQEAFTYYRQNVLGSACAHYRIAQSNHHFGRVEWEQQVLRLTTDFVGSLAVPV